MSEFGIFTPLVRRFESQYIGRKVELVIEEAQLNGVFYYTGTLRISQDNTRRYIVGNTKHLGNTALNTKKTLRDMMMSRFVADIYTQGFAVTNNITIVESEYDSLDTLEPEFEEEKYEEDEEDEEKNDWATDQIDLESENFDDCIIYKREKWQEQRLHAKLDNELEEYFARNRFLPFNSTDILGRY